MTKLLPISTLTTSIKKTYLITLIGLAGCSINPPNEYTNGNSNKAIHASLESPMTLKHLINTHLVTDLYTADPSAHVFNGTLYVYPSHDLDHENEVNDNGDQYDMEDYHVYSYDESAKVFEDHGEALHVDNVPWASKQMWAPDAAYKNGQYYLYFPARDKEGIFRIGVAVADRPEGPFQPNPEPIPGSYSIDPAVYNEDNQAYVVFGGLWGGQLEKWQNGQFDPEGREPENQEPALNPLFAKLSDDMAQFDGEISQLQILDPQGNPLLAGDHDRRYFEGPWIHKYNNTYYLSYSTGDTHFIVYATADNIEGPYTYQGRILEPVLGWTTHHSIVEYQGQWYLFYHDASLSNGVDHKRSMKVAEIHYDEQGRIEPVTTKITTTK